MFRTVGLGPIMSQVVRQIMRRFGNPHPSSWSTESTRARFPKFLSLPSTSAFRTCFRNNLGNQNLFLFQKGIFQSLKFRSETQWILEHRNYEQCLAWFCHLQKTLASLGAEHYPELLSFKRLNIYCVTAGTRTFFIYNAHYQPGGKY